MIKSTTFNMLCFLLLSQGTHSFIHAQVVNDQCETATVIPDVMSDLPFVCIESTNLNALPENLANECEIGSEPTVWFHVTTDNFATLLNIHVTSAAINSPTISLFQAIQGCSNLQPVGLTQNNYPCFIGSNGDAEALGTSVNSNSTYYIAIGSRNSNGGTFELCVNTISISSACVTDRNIEIVARSEGGSLAGPFLPGETVSICFNVNSFTAAGNECQWFQGLVPIFGNGWDPSSFNADGQPLDATINGQPIGLAGNGLYGASTWDWFTDVGYHQDNPFLQVGDLDGNGTIEACHLLYNSDCPDFGGITGGCCVPCWDNPGDILPPGWFAYGINGTCGIPGPPVAVDWGDGNSCECCMGPWSFCFDLTVRSFPDCAKDPATSDLTLGFLTMADGETGSWIGGTSLCALDQPIQITFPLCCGGGESEDEILPDICGEGIVEIALDQPGIEFWTWTGEAINVAGNSEGQGPSGTIVMDTLINTGDSPGIVYYFFEGTGTGGCFTYEHTVTVNVWAPLDVSLMLPVTCDDMPDEYVITSAVSGGSGSYGYLWMPGGMTTPDITIQNPMEGQVYSLFVNDADGCVDTAMITIVFDTTLNVDIASTGNLSCLPGDTVLLTGVTVGGDMPFMYQWTLPDGSMVGGQALEADTAGVYVIHVTDANGCTGVDTVAVSVSDAPEISIAVSGMDSTFCPGDSVALTGVVDSGQPPFQFNWVTPALSDTAQMILSGSPGVHTLFVMDGHGCSDTAMVTLALHDTPVIDTSLSLQEVCAGDSVLMNAMVSGGVVPYTYLWNTPIGMDTSQSIYSDVAGDYLLMVADNNGCDDSAHFTLTVQPLPDVDLGADTIHTAVDVILDAGPGFAVYAWSDGSITQTTTVAVTGWVFVTVTDMEGCMDVDSVFIDFITLVSDPRSKATLQIHPNPSDGMFIVKGHVDVPQQLQLDVLNALGQVIYSLKPQGVHGDFSYQVDLRSAIADIYFVRVYLGDAVFWRRVVIHQ